MRFFWRWKFYKKKPFRRVLQKIITNHLKNNAMERQKYFSELVPTQRKYTDHDTKRVFTLYTHPSTHNYELIYDNPKNDLDMAKGTSVGGFFLCPFDSVSIKLNTGKVINLGYGEFYTLKENEEVTHKKYAGFAKFRKI